MAPQNDFPTFKDKVPCSEEVTDYDRLHFKAYIRLLDGVAAGATYAEMSYLIFGIDASQEPERAHRVVESHLKRAEWMTQHGYRRLLGPEDGTA